MVQIELVILNCKKSVGNEIISGKTVFFFVFVRYTCIVEYSLICATVCFVFWTNIGKEISAYHRVIVNNKNFLKLIIYDLQYPIHAKKKKKNIKIFSNSFI